MVQALHPPHKLFQLAVDRILITPGTIQDLFLEAQSLSDEEGLTHPRSPVEEAIGGFEGLLVKIHSHVCHCLMAICIVLQGVEGTWMFLEFLFIPNIGEYVLEEVSLPARSSRDVKSRLCHQRQKAEGLQR